MLPLSRVHIPTLRGVTGFKVNTTLYDENPARYALYTMFTIWPKLSALALSQYMHFIFFLEHGVSKFIHIKQWCKRVVTQTQKSLNTQSDYPHSTTNLQPIPSYYHPYLRYGSSSSLTIWHRFKLPFKVVGTTAVFSQSRLLASRVPFATNA
jgi:hypothetical protein